MSNGLVIIGEIAIQCMVRVCIRSDDITLHQKVKVRDGKGVHIFCARLKCKLVCPPAIASLDFLQKEFVNHNLAIHRHILYNIPLEVKTQDYVVTASILL